MNNIVCCLLFAVCCLLFAVCCLLSTVYCNFMQLHQLQPIYKLKKKKRIGRGGKRGTYSGKGVKGQKSRAGRKMVPIIREVIKRYPKLRGYRFKPMNSFVQIINLETLERKFNIKQKGISIESTSKISNTINPKTLIKMGLISKIRGKIPKVKILGAGGLTKKLTIEGCEISKSAKEKIEKVGGTVRQKVKSQKAKGKITSQKSKIINLSGR